MSVTVYILGDGYGDLQVIAHKYGVNTMSFRYLGVYIERTSHFNCNIREVKNHVNILLKYGSVESAALLVKRSH